MNRSQKSSLHLEERSLSLNQTQTSSFIRKKKKKKSELNKSIKKSRIIKETLARVKRNHGQNLKIISQYGGNFIVTMKNGTPVLHSTDPKASEN